MSPLVFELTLAFYLFAVVALVIHWRRKVGAENGVLPEGWRTTAFFLILASFGLFLFLAGNFLMPSTWRWQGNNLQVKLEDNRPSEQGGLFNEGFGWSKMDFLNSGRQAQGRMSGHSDFAQMHATHSAECSIVAASRAGVMVRFKFSETYNGQMIVNVDKQFVVPTYGEARVNISPGLDFVGRFE